MIAGNWWYRSGASASRVQLALVGFCFAVQVSCCAASGNAQEQSGNSDRAAVDRQASDILPARKALYDKFTKLLTGAKFVGHFTIDGKSLADLRKETYEIEKVEKLPEGDMWVITARIEYGDKDLKVPVPLEVKWAGTTPVLTLDHLTIPGLGTFAARVLLHQDKYVGTWRHDEVGGHLFGAIKLKSSSK